MSAECVHFEAAAVVVTTGNDDSSGPHPPGAGLLEEGVRATDRPPVAHTPQAWANLARNPEDREQAIRGLLERAGGKFHSLYYCFGEHDLVVLMEAPDAATAAAVSIAATAAGHLKSVQTTVLMTVKESMEAMRKAGKLTYQAPKG